MDPSLPKRRIMLSRRNFISWKLEGMQDIDIIICLRQRTVPKGYSHHYWIPGNFVHWVTIMNCIFHYHACYIIYYMQGKKRHHWKC